MTTTTTASHHDGERHHVHLVRLASAIRGIKLEIATGIKPTRGFSATRLAREYGYTGRTKAGALAHLESVYEQMLAEQ